MNKQKIVIGIDEAGRGPLAGPVVACALSFDHNNLPSKSLISSLKDSKQLSESKREKIFDILIQTSQNNNCIQYGVGVVDSETIDKKNIKQATKLAMEKAINELLWKIDEKNIHSILIDGNDNFSFANLSIKPIYVIKGDQKINEIKAASIIAKTFRDKLMITYSHLYPNNNFHLHKGYGTKKHMESIKNKSDLTNIHRMSYKPIGDILKKKPKLLIHVCCGPDASIPIKDLKENYEIIPYWYDPNIEPKKEYTKRLHAFKKICKLENIKFYEGEYENKVFLNTIKGLEQTPEQGEKCIQCYNFRLQKSVVFAKKLQCDFWTTTLTMSPHKPIKQIFLLGKKLEEKFHIPFLDISFRKNDGFLRSIEYTTKNKIYRQNYCGCKYSDSYPTKT